MIHQRTPQLSQYSWATSAGVHAAVIVVLSTFATVPVVERAEIAGARTVIDASFAEPVTAAAEPTPVEVTQTEPEPVTEPESESPSETVTLPEQTPLNPTAAPSTELSPVSRADVLLARSDLAEIAVQTGRPSATSPPQSQPVNTQQHNPVLRQTETVQRNPAPQRTTPPTMQRQRPMMQDIQELAEAELPPVPPAAKPQTIGTSETTPARVLRNPSPVYPPDAVSRGLEGLVLLKVTVAEDGRVNAVEVVKSSGVRQLDESARDAVRSWQFQPARRDGKAVEWSARLPVRFRL